MQRCIAHTWSLVWNSPEHQQIHFEFLSIFLIDFLLKLMEESFIRILFVLYNIKLHLLLFSQIILINTNFGEYGMFYSPAGTTGIPVIQVYLYTLYTIQVLPTTTLNRHTVNLKTEICFKQFILNYSIAIDL